MWSFVARQPFSFSCLLSLPPYFLSSIHYTLSKKGKKRNASVSGIKKKNRNTCTQGLFTADTKHTGPLKIKPFTAQLLSNSSDILPDPYRAVRKVIRKKNTMALSWAGHAAGGHIETIGAIQQKPHRSFLRPQNS